MKNRGMMQGLMAVLCWCWWFVAPVSGQTVLEYGRWIEIDACEEAEGMIYDDGGATGSYSLFFEGGCIINAQPGVTISLEGNYDITQSFTDMLSIYDGSLSEGDLVGSYTGSGTINLTLTSGTIVIRFVSNSGTPTGGFALHWRASGFASSCGNTVSNLAASNIGLNSATLSWNSTGATSQFRILCGPTDSVVTGNTVTLNGLTPYTHYTFRISDIADADEPCCMASVAFRTLCGDEIAPPLEEHFDDYTADTEAMPSCWTMSSNYDQGIQTRIESLADGINAALALRCGAGATPEHYGMAILPPMSVPVDQIRLRFRALTTIANTAFEIGICGVPGTTQNWNDVFEAIDTIQLPANNQWQDIALDLAAYQGTGHRVAFRIQRSMQAANNQYVVIDDLYLETCGVSSLTTGDKDRRSLTLRWDTYGEPQRVDLSYRAVGTTTADTVHDVASPLHLGGLEPGTTYLFTLTSICNADLGSQTTTVIVDSTLNDLPLTITYCEDFETPGEAIPAGWRALSDATDDATWCRQQGSTRYAGEQALTFQGANAHPLRTIILPPLEGIGVEWLQMAMMIQSATPDAKLEVGVMESPEELSSYTAVDTLEVGQQGSFSRVMADFSNYSGNGEWIALRVYNGGYNSTIRIDNLQLSTCMLSGLSVASTGMNSVELRWDQVGELHLGDSVRLLYGRSGFSADTASMIVVPVRGDAVELRNGKQITRIEGLEANTAYQFLILPMCVGATEECDIERLEAHTLNSEPTLPYCIDFEGENMIPAGWNILSGEDGLPSVTDTLPAHGGQNTLTMLSKGNRNQTNSAIALPEIEVDDMRNLVISFYTWTAHNNVHLDVGVMADIDNMSLFVPDTDLLLHTNRWEHHVLSLSAASSPTGRIVFRQYHTGASGQGRELFIDDLSISNCQVLNLHHNCITSHSVAIRWDSVGAAFDGAQVEIGRSGFDAGEGLLSDVLHGGLLTIDTLQPGQTYEYYVRSVCASQSAQCSYDRMGFATLSAATRTSWCYDFEESDIGNYPTSWQQVLIYNNTPRVVADRPFSGTHSLLLSSGGGSSMAALPPIEDDDLGSITLTFMARGSIQSDAGDTLTIGMIADTYDTSTFHAVASFGVSHTDYRRYTVALPSPGAIEQIALKKKGLHNVWIDDLRLSRCTIDSIEPYNVTTTAASVRWTAGGDIDSVALTLTDGIDTTTAVVRGVNGHTFDGLEPGTPYSLSLLPYCSGSINACMAESVAFSTNAVPVDDGYCSDDSARLSPATPLHMLEAAETPLSGLLLSFSAHGAEGSRLEVGVMDYPMRPNSFEALDTVTLGPQAQRYHVALADYEGQGRYIAFRLDGNAAWVGDISLSASHVTHIEVSGISDTSFVLRWQRLPGQSPGVYVGYRPMGENEAAATTAYTEEDEIAIGGLANGGQYLVELWAQGQDTSKACQAESVAVHLMESPFAIPTCITFEECGSMPLPAGWYAPTGGVGLGNTPAIGAKALQLAADSSGAVAVMPMLAEEAGTLYMDFHCLSDAEATLEAGIMDNPHDTATFQSMATFETSSGGWRHFYADINAGEATALYIAFRVKTAGVATAAVSIDQITLRRCRLASATAYDATDTSIALSWTGAGTDSIYVEYREGTADFEPGEGSRLTLSAHDTVINGLTPGTWYTFHFHTACHLHDAGCSFEVDSLRTTMPSHPLPYCETFDDDSLAIPAGWYRSANQDFPHITAERSRDGAKSLALHATASQPCHTVLPALPREAMDAAVLSFDSYSTTSSGSLIVGTMTNPYHEDTFVGMDTLQQQSNRWVHHVLPLSVGAAPYIALRYESHEGEPYYIDNLKLSQCGVTDIAMDIRDTGIELHWRPLNAPHIVEVEYGLQGFERGSGATASVEDTLLWLSNAQLALLDPQVAEAEASRQSIDFYIVARCDDSSDYGCHEHPVSANRSIAMPYCEDFEEVEAAGSGLPASWSVVLHSDENDASPHVEELDGRKVMTFRSPEEHGTNIVLLPQLPAGDSLAGKWVSVLMQSDMSNSVALELGFLSDTADATTFVAMTTIRNTANARMERLSGQLNGTPANQRLALRATSTNSTRTLRLDELTLTSCPMPHLEAIGAHAIMATVDDEAPDYWIALSTEDPEPGQAVEMVHVTEASYLIEGLEPGTSYSIVSQCSSGETPCWPASRVTTGEALAVPLCDDFSSYGSGIGTVPYGWSTTASPGNSNYPRVDTESGRAALHFRNNSSSTCIATMPELALDSLHHGEIYISMQANANSALVVGLTDRQGEPTTFMAIDTLRNHGNDREEHHVSLHGLEDAGLFLAFSQLSPTNSWSDIYIDRLYINNFPLPEAELVDWNSVRVSIDSGIAGSYTIEYGPHGFAPGEGVRLVVEGHDTLLEGLSGNSRYDIYAWRSGAYEECGTCHSRQCRTFATVSTSTRTSLPYCEHFEGYGSGAESMASGWMRHHSHETYAPGVEANSEKYPQVVQRGDGIYALRMRNRTGEVCQATMPLMEADSIQQLNIYLSMRTESYANEALVVGLTANPNDPTDFKPFDTLTNTTNSWQRHHLALAGYEGQARFVALRLLVSQATWRNLDIDFINVQSCPPAVVHLVSHNSVALAVDSTHEADYWLAFGPSGAAEPDTVVHITDNPFTVEGLSDDMLYDFEARCDSAGTTCAGPVSIATSHLEPLPYCNHYDSEGGTLMLAGTLLSNSLWVMPEIAVDELRGLQLTLSLLVPDEALTYAGVEVGVLSHADDAASFETVALLCNQGSGWQRHQVSMASYDGTGRFVALRLRNTSNSTYTVQVDDLMVEDCHIPADLRMTLVDHNTALLQSSEPMPSSFYIEYDTAGFAPGEGTTVLCDTLPLLLVLESGRAYDLYPLCHSGAATCRQPLQIVTLGDAESLPLCIDTLAIAARAGETALLLLPPLAVDTIADIVVSAHLTGTENGILELGVMNDPYDTSTFISVAPLEGGNELRHTVFPIASPDPDAHFLALRLRADSSDAACTISNLAFSRCGMWGASVCAIGSEVVELQWQSMGSGSVEIVRNQNGLNGGDTITVEMSQNHVVLDGLEPLSNYTLFVRGWCGPDGNAPCQTSYFDTFTVFTPGGAHNCIDPTNLTAEFVTCYYGTFANPWAQQGVVDYGCSSALSRHTVHYDPEETDPRTGGLLHTVPAGAAASVRLGNWNTSTSHPQAEAMEYILFVDSSLFDLLVLRYAAVLQDPDHAPSDQPRFTMQILDADHQLLSQCSYADFRANRTMGWNTVEGSQVLWKDWTTVGVDLSPYAGQTVLVRLTTYDCNEGSHFGYTYFTLECSKKHMEVMFCGNVEENTFTAPAGFSYTWYTDPDSIASSTVSTGQSITVSTSSGLTYYCRCAFINDTSCSFTLSAFAGTRHPLALMEPTVTVHDCLFDVSFENLSTISNDGVTPLGNGEPCESALWDFGNGESSTLYHATTTYSDTGLYTVQLISSIGQGECSDTLTYALRLDWPEVTNQADTIADICLGDTLTLTAPAVSHLVWSTGETDSTITVSPDTTTTFSCFFSNRNGCPDTMNITLSVHPPAHSLDTAVVCANAFPYLWMDSTIGRGDSDSLWLQALLATGYGCDSVASLLLVAADTSEVAERDTIVMSQLPWTFLGLTFNSNDLVPYNNGYATATDTIVLTNHRGCDSVVHYTLMVHRTAITELDSTICGTMLPFYWGPFAFDSSAFTVVDGNMIAEGRDTLTAWGGEDSMVVYRVTLRTPYSERDTMAVCNNMFPFSWRDTVVATGTAGTTELTISIGACDSTATLQLTILPSPSHDEALTLCSSALPYQWHDTTIAAPATGQHSLTHTLLAANGCDSTVTLTLTVNESYLLNVTEEVCLDEMPYAWHDTILDDTGQATASLLAANGCDSTVTLSLFVHPTYDIADSATLCPGNLPYRWRDTVIYFAPPGYSVFMRHDTTRFGCDSLATLLLNLKSNVTTYLRDSICEGDTYFFNGRVLQNGGFFGDTTRAANGCDSIVELTLHQLYRPDIEFTVDHDCHARQYYIRANAGVDFLWWSSGRSWNADWGPQNGSYLVVHPDRTTTLYLTADYNAWPTCPATDSLTLHPIVMPQALMSVNTEALTPDNNSFTALSRSTGAQWLAWYVDSENMGGGNELSYSCDLQADSVVLMLVAGNELCVDSTTTVLPIHRMSFYVPNAFTPDEATNNEFCVQQEGMREAQLEIFTRGGQRLFSSKEVGARWNGTCNGIPCPQGAYVWKLRYRSAVDPGYWHEEIGTVMLLR